MRKLLTLLLSTLVLLGSQQDSLTNEAVLKLVKSGLSDDLIVSMIQNQPGKYSLSQEDVSKLKEAGASEKVLKAMAEKATASNPLGSVKIEIKTPVRLAVDEPISSKSAKAGDALKLVAAEEVAVNGQVVIAKGAPATGRITTAEKKSFANRNGKLEVAVDSVQAVDGHNVALDGNISVGGGGVAYMHTGKEAQIGKGQIINAVVASETTVTPRAKPN